MSNYWEYIFWGNSVIDYLVSLVILCGAIAAIEILKRVILKRLIRWAKKSATSFDDFVLQLAGKVMLPLLYFGAFYVSVTTLNLLAIFQEVLKIIGVALLVFLGARFVIVVVNYGFDLSVKRRGNVSLQRSLKGILRVARVIIWGLAIVLFLDNLGFKVTSLVAGLGIGGIAVAVAAQAVLKDVFSYFSIIFDHPFEIGDFVIVGDYLGTVEYVGIKTTRIRSLSGEQVVFSNTDLTDSRLRNYKRMEKRRVVFKFGVTYQTGSDKLRLIPDLVKEIINKIPDAACDRAHFFAYGDFSLIFEVVYYVAGGDYNKYMDIQQTINLSLKDEFETRRIEFAYPTQVVYLNRSVKKADNPA